MVQKLNNKRISKKVYNTKNQKRSKRTKYMMAGGGFSIVLKYDIRGGQTYELSDIRADMTIRDIKNIIMDLLGIGPQNQILVKGGQALKEQFPISVYGITSGSIIHLVLKLVGNQTNNPPPSLIDIQREADSLRTKSNIFDMRLPTDKVLKALVATDNDEARAIELLLSESGSPLAAPGETREIFKMGFHPTLVMAALERASNDEQLAISYILDGLI
jgi:hypothetical protein